MNNNTELEELYTAKINNLGHHLKQGITSIIRDKRVQTLKPGEQLEFAYKPIKDVVSYFESKGINEDIILKLFDKYYEKNRTTVPFNYMIVNKFIAYINEQIAQAEAKTKAKQQKASAAEAKRQNKTQGRAAKEQENTSQMPTQNATGQSCYDILQISTNANERSIIKAYRTLALKAHPNKGGDEEEFKKLGSAYEECLKKIGISKGGRRKTLRSHKRKGTRKMRR